MREFCANCVLLVDDDPTIRELLSFQLAEAGFHPEEAQDGIDGLVKLRHTLPKVIISDLQMPRMSGIEFISVVRRRFPFIRVIVLSGSIPEELPAEARPDIWFEKDPLQIPKILDALQELIRTTPTPAYVPPTVNTPVRTRPAGAGHSVLTCTDCLRPFQVAGPPAQQAVEQVAMCVHCGAQIPILV